MNDKSLIKNVQGSQDIVFKTFKEAQEAIQVHGSDKVYNATIGALFDEQEGFVALESVWSELNNIEDKKLAHKTSLISKKQYIEYMTNHYFKGLDISISHTGYPTPGGSGALSSALRLHLDSGDTVLLPNVGWGPYKTMASSNNLEMVEYNMFKNDRLDLDSIKELSMQSMSKQGKVFIIINDPCHNPTGYSMSYDEWHDLTDFMNELSMQGPVVLVNDIAYIDYAKQGVKSRKYMELFNNNHPNFMVLIAASLSKSYTGYGLRAGALIALSNNKAALSNFDRAISFIAHSVWGRSISIGIRLYNTINQNLEILNNVNTERQKYIDLLGARSDVFIAEAKEASLPIYPSQEGFFVTLEIKDDEFKNKLFHTLKENLIFTVPVAHGIRIALCSMPIHKVKGLASRINEVRQSII